MCRLGQSCDSHDCVTGYAAPVGAEAQQAAAANAAGES